MPTSNYFNYMQYGGDSTNYGTAQNSGNWTSTTTIPLDRQFFIGIFSNFDKVKLKEQLDDGTYEV
jgi:hypothetical protein